MFLENEGFGKYFSNNYQLYLRHQNCANKCLWRDNTIDNAQILYIALGLSLSKSLGTF